MSKFRDKVYWYPAQITEEKERRGGMIEGEMTGGEKVGMASSKVRRRKYSTY